MTQTTAALRAALVLLASAPTLSACDSADDLELAWKIPPEISIVEPQLYRARDFGMCAIAVFQLSPETAAAIQAKGLAALDGANTSRGEQTRGCKYSTRCTLLYAPWAEGPAYAGLPEWPQRALHRARACIKDSGYAEAFSEVTNKGGGLFTYPIDSFGRDRDEVLIILPAQQVVVVIPH